jgi:multidrug efflux pump subunit AcrA (membrane-fusion protein)
VLRLRVGDGATVRLGGAATLPATVAQIAEGADAATRTVEVELRLDREPPAGWRSGFLVDTVVRPQPGAARTAVPLAALVEGQGNRAFVFVLTPDGHAVRRSAVEIEIIEGDRAYLRAPLPAGAHVVTTGAEFLTDGRAVVDAGRQP